ncbi:uncharacterized protein EDB93DRAFT_1331291 [Suillus bovinus]|uniref:uncharacterized protein n=1 Tax=Suillus bovinus TaxID=48563 RepID=UPI001B879ABC|nr:uncharacterized protein EDB93DRAFT_1331291 [Suillus bovinus]KAG2134146.1 hypothetical protein EDB93DRAFT_1331291 [Suillus bovinus]
MKPMLEKGVVDARLNVYGVAGLKVADMSIAPKSVGTNTYSTALLIGEKAALIIAEDLGMNCREYRVIMNMYFSSTPRMPSQGKRGRDMESLLGQCKPAILEVAVDEK